MLSKLDLSEEDFNFIHLPLFSRFILDHHLTAFVQYQLSLAPQLKIPLLQGLRHLSEDQLFNYALSATKEFLETFANNQAGQRMRKAIDDWTNNRLEYHDNSMIEPDDVFLLNHMRKKAFMRLLNLYTTEPDKIMAVIDELDTYFLAQERLSTNTYFQILKNRIEEESYFKEKLVVTSPGFYYLFDIENDRQLQTSEKLFEYLGYTREEFGNNDRFFRTLIHEEDLVTAEGYLGRLRMGKDGEVQFFEYRLRDRRGHYRWMRNYESIYARNAAGVAIHSIGIAFDITKERLITEELVQREEELLEAQELSNIGSYVWNIETNHTYTTPQALKILGLGEDWQITDLMDRVHPADLPLVTKAWEKTLSGGGDFDIEYRCHVNNEEKIIWARGTAVLKNHKPVLMKGTVMDLTDRHKIISKLTQSEELYRQAQSMNKLGNWTWDMLNDKLFWSDELYRIYGLEPQSEQLNFDRFFSFVHHEDRENRVRKLQEQMRDSDLRDYYFRILAADGQEKILYGQSQVLLDESGNPFKMIGTCQDVTKQKELENSLFEKTLQLERSNASLEEFAYITSHDLKEPLRKISVFGDRLLMLNETQLAKENKATVVKIVDCAARMQRMVDDILSLSEVSFNHKFKQVNLNELLDEVIQNLDYKIEAVNAQVEHDNLPTALVNETQFRQLFQNLISNSIKFSKHGGVPSIQVRFDYLDKETVKKLSLPHANHSKKYLRLLFIDNGIGFENEFADKIFTIFQRLHSRSEFDGTGIGLAICKKIVDHHHGLIYATGELNVGATFTIIIPVDA